jgi:hypothetical protein
MDREKYEIWTDNTLIASDMVIEDTVILIKGLYREYYKENIQITIKPMERCEVNNG